MIERIAYNRRGGCCKGVLVDDLSEGGYLVETVALESRLSLLKFCFLETLNENSVK